jgi:hypothetical protein
MRRRKLFLFQSAAVRFLPEFGPLSGRRQLFQRGPCLPGIDVLSISRPSPIPFNSLIFQSVLIVFQQSLSPFNPGLRSTMHFSHMHWWARMLAGKVTGRMYLTSVDADAVILLVDSRVIGDQSPRTIIVDSMTYHSAGAGRPTSTQFLRNLKSRSVPPVSVRN